MGQGEAGFVVLSLLSNLPVSSTCPGTLGLQARAGNVAPSTLRGLWLWRKWEQGWREVRQGAAWWSLPPRSISQPGDGAGSRSTLLPATGLSFHSPLWISTLLNYGFGVSFLHVVVGLEFCAMSGRAPSLTSPGGQSHRSVPPHPPGPSPSPALFSPNPALARARPLATRSHCPPPSQ